MVALRLRLLLLLSCFCIHAEVGAQSGSFIRLRSKTELKWQRVVRLGDVAEVSGYRLADRNLLAELDLSDWSADEDSLTLRKNQIHLRLQLAFPELEAINLLGPDKITVTRGARQNREQQMLSELRSELAGQWGVGEEAVRVRLLQPLRSEKPLDRGSFVYDRISTVVPNPARPGTVRVTFLFYDGDRLVKSKRVLVDAQRFADVAIAARPLEKGATIVAEDIQSQWQSIRFAQDYLTQDEVVGKTLRLSVGRGLLLSQRHLVPSGKKSRSVKARDTVKVTTRSGPLMVTMNNGVALQSGAIGDRIRVRNPNSNKILVARIVSPSEVQVE